MFICLTLGSFTEDFLWKKISVASVNQWSRLCLNDLPNSWFYNFTIPKQKFRVGLFKGLHAAGGASQVAQMVKNLTVMQEAWVRSLVGKIPWRRKWLPTPVFLPGNSMDRGVWRAIQSMGLQRVRHDWETNIHICCLGEWENYEIYDDMFLIQKILLCNLPLGAY